MKTMHSKVPLFLLALLFAISISYPSCKYDNLEELQIDSVCDTLAAVSYQSEVEPILTAKCYQCHGEIIYPFLGGGNRLEGYSFLRVFVDNGKLTCAINRTPCAKPMPQGKPKLPESEINTIDTWICQGAPDN